MFSTASENDMVECPYNKYHQMTRKRLIPHLIKCRLSYPDVELCKCPFNASHLVPEPEFTHHVTSCPDKALITQYKYNAVPLKLDEEDRKQPEVDCDDNWDDTEANDYDPQKYASTAKVIRTHIGDLPSNRKEFRKNERKRLGDEDSSEEDEKKSKIKDYDCKKEEEERESKWYEDRGPKSSGSSNQRRDSFQDSLKDWSKERGISGGESIKNERTDRGTTKRKSEDYPLDEDPYYKTNNIRPHYSGFDDSPRRSYLGTSRGSRRSF